MGNSLLKIGIIIFFFIVFSITGISLYKIISTTAPDFSVLWLAASDLPTGKNPYLNPNLFTGVGYPPNTLLFYLPLTLFSYEMAQGIFILSSFITIIAAVFLALKISVNKVPWQFFLIAISLTLVSFPTKFTLGMGQNNAFALLLLLLGFYFYHQKRSLLSGIFLGSAVALKTVFGFFLLFFFLKRAWRVIAWSLLPIVVVILLVALISDITLYNYWIMEIIPPLLNLAGREIYYNQGIIGFVSRITEDPVLRRYIGTAIYLILILTASLLTLKKKPENLQFSLFVIILLLIDTLSWQHHFVWLILPFIALTSSAWKEKKIGIFALIGISYVLISWNIKTPQQFSGILQSLFLSHVFYGTLLLLLINSFLILKRSRGTVH